jgi:hypothetical protein
MRFWFSRHRLTIFRVLAVLAGLLFLVANIPVAISPWGPLILPGGTERISDPDLHRWSAALAGGPDIAGAVLLFYVAWRPLMSHLIIQWLALAVIVFLATQIPFIGPVVVLLMIPFLLVLAAYPKRRSLLEAAWSDGVNPPLLALGVVVAVFLLPDAVAALLAQVRAADDLAVHYNWASNAEHLINLSLAALLASMRKPGALPLAMMVGAVLVFLGAAAITLPATPGSWGTTGGVAAIAVGIGFALLAVVEWRRRVRADYRTAGAGISDLSA